MAIVVPLISLIIVLTLSIVLVRIGTVALTLTGISREIAKFQARSAFTGAGFTTAESEQIVNHPVRRRIIMFMMLLGNLGIATTMATLVLSLGKVSDAAGSGSYLYVVALLLGLFGLFLVAKSQWLDRQLSRVIEKALKKYTDIDVSDYAALFRLAGDYAVSEVHINEDDWIAELSLADARLSHEGILILGIETRKGQFIGAPKGDTVINAGDTLILYGRQESIAELDTRTKGLAGYTAHIRAIKQQHAVQQKLQEKTENQQAESPHEAKSEPQTSAEAAANDTSGNSF